LIKTFHESPNSIFKEVQKLTDGDYALVHLLEKNKTYRKLFMESHREIILDNSLYELGKSFNQEKYIKWIDKLRPDWYIIPDAFNDYEKTIQLFNDFNILFGRSGEKIPKRPSKSIAVVHGKDLDDFLKCFDHHNKHKDIDMIGIPFISNAYKEIYDFGGDLNKENPTDEDKMNIGRIYFILSLDKLQNEVNEKPFHIKNIHLLGTWNPSEFQYYRFSNFIYSLDTSNPVMHGIEGKKYPDDLQIGKPNTKLDEVINSEFFFDQLEKIKYNINLFRNYLKVNK